MSTKKNQHNFCSPKGKPKRLSGFPRSHNSPSYERKEWIKSRERRGLFSPPYLTEYLQQQINEYQATVDFLENFFGEAASRDLCEIPAKHIVVLGAIINCLEELRELREIQARQRTLIDLKLESLKSGQGPESSTPTKTESP